MRYIKSILTTFVVGLLVAIGLTSCGSKDPVDALELKKDFVNKTFLTDGIEEMKVASISDGDTALFKSGNMSFNVRFYGVNTPESTWQIEKWGKTASNFTKEKLNNAESVVIEGSTTPPSQESNKRWLCYVWYKPKSGDRYINLNLEIVRNGFSNSSVNPDDEYYKYFEEAMSLAEKEDLAIHSNKVDENFDESLEKISLKDIALNPANYDQSYVSVECTIKSRDGSNVVIADIVDGTEYKFPVYLGYGSLGDDRICRPGNRTKFVGRVSSHNNTWQLTGIEAKLGTKETTSVLLEGYEMSFGQEQSDSFYKYNNISVQEVTLEGENYIVKGTAKNVTHTANITLIVPQTYVVSISKGQSIQCKAYNNGESIKPSVDSFTLNIVSKTDIRVI